MYSIEALINQKPLTMDHLAFSDSMDRAFTYLIMSDYDWMHYRLIAEFPVGTGTVMKAEFEYAGVIEAMMYVSLNGKMFKKVFDSRLFEKHIKKYMEQHIKSWDGEYAFCGEELAICFFNEILADPEHDLEETTKHIINIP